MVKSKSFFSLLSAKRYYHLIAFKAEKDYSIKKFWDDCDVSNKSSVDSSYKIDEFEIELGKILSNLQFYNGGEDYSVNSDGNPPFQYELFAIEIKQLRLFIFGFPFKSLAKTVIESLIVEKKLLNKGSFLRTNLNKLIKINHKTDFVNEMFSSYFSGVELTLTGDTNITSVNLDGDKPLESVLYKTVFLNKIIEDECKLEKCSLKFETTSNNNNDIPKTRSNVHIDLFGNYKLYVHGSGNNIFTIPYMFNLFNSYDCLEQTLINPINRLNDE